MKGFRFILGMCGWIVQLSSEKCLPKTSVKARKKNKLLMTTVILAAFFIFIFYFLLTDPIRLKVY